MNDLICEKINEKTKSGQTSSAKCTKWLKMHIICAVMHTTVKNRML